jgi:hypothetical protein
MAKAKEISEKAGNDFLQNGTDPSEAIAKHGAELFSDPFAELVTTKCNHFIFNHKFATDRRAEWPVATLDRVKEAMTRTKTAAAAQSAVSPIWGKDIDGFPNARRSTLKTAADGSAIDPLGFKVREKAAEDFSEFNKNQAIRDYFNVQLAIQLEKDAEFLGHKAFSEAVDAFEDYIEKRAALGEPTFDVAFNVAAHCELSKSSAAIFADSCIRHMEREGRISKEKFAVYEESLKTASLDFLENGYPILRGGDHVILKLNTLLAQQGCGNKVPVGSSGIAWDPKIKYKVEEVMVPRQSRAWIQRDASVRGHNIS